MQPISRIADDILTDPRVSALDPLHLDSALPAIRTMNATGDRAGLIRLLRQAIPSGLSDEVTLQEALAVMRDLGLLVGSLRRLGTQPVTAVPELGPVLLKLAAMTGMVPRNTLLHYTVWNPEGARQRLYTGDDQERMLIASVCVTVSRLAQAAETCERLRGLGPDQSEFAPLLERLLEQISCLRDSMDIVRAGVTPRFFAVDARPYYDDIDVGGVDYLGPAAAHVPLYLVDLQVWASDGGDRSGKDFMIEWSRYGLPGWNVSDLAWTTGPSIVTRVADMCRQVGGKVPAGLLASAEVLSRVLRALVIFRGRHYTVTREAYEVDLRIYPVGSSGGDLELLGSISAQTREHLTLLRRYVSDRAGTSDART
jgi:hypothetical protein